VHFDYIRETASVCWCCYWSTGRATSLFS